MLQQLSIHERFCYEYNTPSNQPQEFYSHTYKFTLPPASHSNKRITQTSSLTTYKDNHGDEQRQGHGSSDRAAHDHSDIVGLYLVLELVLPVVVKLGISEVGAL